MTSSFGPVLVLKFGKICLDIACITNTKLYVKHDTVKKDKVHQVLKEKLPIIDDFAWLTIEIILLIMKTIGKYLLV